MKAPIIDWIQPILPAFCLWAMTITAYGGLRGDSLEGILAAIGWLFMAWADVYLTGEKEKALPRRTYLV